MRGMTSPTDAVYRRRIESFDHPDHQSWKLGRHVEHDPRSLAYQVEADGTSTDVTWDAEIAVLDQGDVGSCTGNATVDDLGTDPFYPEMEQLAASDHTVTLDEPMALRVYSAAEKIDGGQGYPPEDEGSSGLSAAKAAKNSGYISGYQHMTSLAACKTAIQKSAFLVGCNWYTSFDSPDENGLVGIAPGATVRGGHEICCRGYVGGLWRFRNSWGTGFGVEGEFFMSDETLTELLAEQGDATLLVPLSQPAPTPKPVPTPPAPVAGRTVEFSAADGAALDKWAAEPHLFHNSSVAAKAWKDGVTQ